MPTLHVETDDFAAEHSFLGGLTQGKYSRSELVFVIQIYTVNIVKDSLGNSLG